MTVPARQQETEKMRTLYILLTIISVTFLTGCDNTAPFHHESRNPEGTPVSIVTGISLPEMNLGSKTRGMGDAPGPDELLNTLHVNLFVFDAAGVMLQFIGPEKISVIDVDRDSGHVYFKVTGIYTSSQPRRLHFIVTSADDLRTIQGGEHISAMSGETTVIPALIVAGDTDAYWGLKEVTGITADMEIDIRLIRNFVKISVVSAEDENVFRLLGYTVANRPGKGTVAPYNHASHTFAGFIRPDNTLLDYEEIQAQGYHGVNPSGAEMYMTHTVEAEVNKALAESESALASGMGDTPCYFYERSQSSMTSAVRDPMTTYVIVSGLYKGEKYYYKIDIGQDRNGKFGFYDLLRNFRYTIEISEVGGSGAPSVMDAMNGPAHNNLSASTVTRDLFSIGYGGEKIEVSSTGIILTEHTDVYSLRFRYTVPEGTVFDASRLKIYDADREETVEYDMSGVNRNSGKPVSLNGEVIENALLTMDPDGWYALRFSTHGIPADNRRLEQNIRIYYNGGTAGLGRTVTLMLRRPWEFGHVSATDPGIGIQSGFSINLEIPAGLSKTQFPMTITFESDKQNIYARNGSPLTVATGRSGFTGATSDNIILYEYRLEWEDYLSMVNSGDTKLQASFRMNTTSGDDLKFNTSAIDDAKIEGRHSNNNTPGCCIRIADKEHSHIKPYYVNITRQ